MQLVEGKGLVLDDNEYLAWRANQASRKLLVDEARRVAKEGWRQFQFCCVWGPKDEWVYSFAVEEGA